MQEGLLFKHVTRENQCYISFNLQLLADVLSDILLHSQMGRGNCFNNFPSGILPLDNLAMIFAPTNISIMDSRRYIRRSSNSVQLQDELDTEVQEEEVPYVLEEFLKFLTANNICTRLSRNYVIMPAGLDTTLPGCVQRAEDGQVGADTFLAGNKCKRIYKMRFLPLGFWNILLMRLLANLLPISLPGGIELSKLEQFETIPLQTEYCGHESTHSSLPRDFRTNMDDISKSYLVKCLPNGTIFHDGVRYELKEYLTSEVYYWATGLVISSDQGWNLKICNLDETSLEPGILTNSQGVQLSLYADNDNVEARLLRIAHDTIMQTIQMHFPGLCFTTEKGIPWVEVYALVDNLSTLLPMQETCPSHPSTFKLKLLSDILLHSLSPAAANSQLDLREAAPDLLIKDMSSNLNLTQNSNYIFFEGSADQEDVFMEKQALESCYFHRCFCSIESRHEIEKSSGGLKQLILLESPYKQLMREAHSILKISNESVVKFIGVSFHPPACLLARSAYGSLKTLLTSNNRGLDTIVSHTVAMQVVRGLFFLEVQNICHIQLTSDTVLVHCKDPMLIKLSDSGISHYSKTQAMVNTRIEQDLLLEQEPSIPLLQFGFLLYELSTGWRPFEGVHSLQEVMRLALHSKLYLNIEADLLYKMNEYDNYDENFKRRTSATNLLDGRSVQMGYSSATDTFELKQAEVSACHRLCMQPLLDNCLNIKNRIILDLPMIASKLTLCAGEIGWSPLSSDINVQCIVCTRKPELYWSSGTRGLLVGHINPRNGKCMIRALTKPDKRRHNSEQLQAVGNVTVMKIVESTNQLWIGIENMNKGALYVYDLPDMNNYYCGQLQDAVLSLMPIDKNWESVKELKPDQEGLEMLKYRVLVGLANGNIMVFMGMKNGDVIHNPLEGEKAVLLQENKPCRGIIQTPRGLIWAACGHKMLVINPLTLKEQPKFKGIAHHREQEILAPYFSTRNSNRFVANETVTDMVISGAWIWTIARRCSYIWIWDWETGRLLLRFDLQILPDINRKEVSELTAIAPQGNLIWVGTKTGTLLLLDVVMIRSLVPEVEKFRSNSGSGNIQFSSRKSIVGNALKAPLVNSYQSQDEEPPRVSDLVIEESPLIAYQHCSRSKIRSIQPLPTVHISGDVEVVVSVEQNEIASRLMVWRFQSSAIQSRTKLCSSAYSSNSYSKGGTLKRGSDITSPSIEQDSDESEDDSFTHRANTLSLMKQNSDELQDNVIEQLVNGDDKESENKDSQESFNL
ncbi:hypothetical protein LOD99_3536 [Oopsacas minuta]|uniref:Protein kinase domain-containing protein n=1 Tax=Oopsacas minuta TaxID=111878 RepID=A0AAV7JY47_9METZ|nr:hypothetical protein LOD99_3536 [Oopsacas minuta]